MIGGQRPEVVNSSLILLGLTSQNFHDVLIKRKESGKEVGIQFPNGYQSKQKRAFSGPLHSGLLHSSPSSCLASFSLHGQPMHALSGSLVRT